MTSSSVSILVPAHQPPEVSSSAQMEPPTWLGLGLGSGLGFRLGFRLGLGLGLGLGSGAWTRAAWVDNGSEIGHLGQAGRQAPGRSCRRSLSGGEGSPLGPSRGRP